jgi:hypothetical protein
MAPWDISGTLCEAPPMSDAEVRAELVGVPLLVDHDLQQAMCGHYNTRAFFTAVNGEGRVFSGYPTGEAERQARMEAWRTVIRAHPVEYLSHRWHVMREVLGLSDLDIWEPVCRDFGLPYERMVKLGELHVQSWFQRRVGQFAERLGHTLVYRPWVYLLLGLIAFGYAIKRRDGFIAALAASGIVYELPYFFFAPSPDYRYSHWMVTCTTIAVAIIFVSRLREGLRLRARSRSRASTSTAGA